MDIGKSFSYVLDDKSWLKKVAIGGLVSLVPVFQLVVPGYGLRVLKNVAQESAEPLPEWDDWGGDFVKGVLMLVAGLIYSLPAIFVSIIGAIVTAVAGNSSGDVEGVAAVLMLCINCLSGLWGLIVGLWTPAAVVNYAAKGEFSAFFEFETIWKMISDNIGSYLTALVVALIAGIAGSLGTIACVIGVIFTSFYATLVGMHAYGQFAREVGAITGGGASDDTAAFADMSLPEPDAPVPSI